MIKILEELVGQVLDNKYQIEKRIGQGGMGAVYLATHVGTGRPVALKIIVPQFMSNEEFVERFKREAKAAGLLSHPNVVNVTDFGFTEFNTDKLAYLVMEYLNGCNLGDLLEKKKTLPLQFVVDIVEQVCLAIELAHNRGIVHRDLKPDNIWLEPNGRGGYTVKVLDFGLAKLKGMAEPASDSKIKNTKDIVEKDEKTNLETNVKDTAKVFSKGTIGETLISVSENPLESKERDQILVAKVGSARKTEAFDKKATVGEAEPSTVPAWLTRVGAILGTPIYMSPEQYLGGQLDARSDIYSLGVIVYQMLSGDPPFVGNNLYQLMYSHTQAEPIHLKKKCRKVPNQIADLVMTALAKDPNKRPISAKAFAKAMRANTEGEVPLIRQSFDIYRNNFLRFFPVSILINLPIVLLAFSMICFLLDSSNNYLSTPIIQAIWLIAIFSLVNFSNKLNILTFAPVVNEFASISSTSVSIVKLFSNLAKNLIGLISTSILSYGLVLFNLIKLISPGWKLQVSYIVYPAVLAIEGKTANVALERSKELVSKLKGIAGSIQVRRLLISVGVFLLFFFVLIIDESLFGSDEQVSQNFRPSRFFLVTLLAGTLMVLSQPVIAMANLLFYFRARESAGETINTFISNDIRQDAYIPSYLPITHYRKVILSVILVVLIILANISFILFVPPKMAFEFQIPKIAKIPDSENAWIDYKLAIEDLLEWNAVSMSNISDETTGQELIRNRTSELLNNETFKGLARVSAGLAEITPQQEAFLESHIKACDHLLNAAKKPKAQFYTEFPTFYSKTPDLSQIRALSYVATAESRRLEKKGKFAESLELNLAVYRMGADLMSEPSGYISYLVGKITCDIALISILHWLKQEPLDTKAYLDIVNRLTEIESKILPLHKMIENEHKSFNISLYQILVEDKRQKGTEGVGFFNLNKSLYGVKIRTYNSTIKRNSLYMLELMSSIERYDFEGAKLVEQKFLASLEKIENIYVGDLIGKILLSIGVADYIRLSKTLYVGQLTSFSVKTFLLALAYKKNTGHFPSNLEEAFSNQGIKVPQDPLVKAPLNYRLENDLPMVWFNGFDKVDNKGKVSYTSENFYNEVDGSDFIFHFNKLPFWYKDPK
jgi:serine/threonine protein kinase